MRRAALACAAALAVLVYGTAASADCAIASARYDGPTGRYPHGVLGDTTEWTELHVALKGSPCPAKSAARGLPDALVFEDVAPRLIDLDRDGAPEIVAVESHQSKGARLAVWGLTKDGFARITATPFIGTRFRWLAPVGAADLDGDGRVEIAYVDRPHLAKVLRVWRYNDRRLTEIASAPGYSNHRIGEPDIAGGIRTCAGRPEMITADGGWQSIVATRLEGGTLKSRIVGPHRGRESFATALKCR